MPEEVYVSTGEGLLKLTHREQGWVEVWRSLTSRRVTVASASTDALVVGTRDGVYRSADGGQNWADVSGGITQRHVRWLAQHPAKPARILVGTEPAAIYMTDDGARTWRDCPEVARLRDENEWYLPYSPEAGCVRGFAFHGPRAYAAVEQGGMLRSDDWGETWRLVDGTTGDPHAPRLEGHIQIDVHSVTVHPSSANLVTAPTGGGLYRSSDGGSTWHQLYDCYCRAVWVDPNDADHMVFGPADGVDTNGRIEETSDGGASWVRSSAGLDAPWPNHMVERFHAVAGLLWAVLSDGRLIVSSLGAGRWESVLPKPAQALAVTSLAL